MKSEYEKAREENIARNNALLNDLGFSSIAPPKQLVVASRKISKKRDFSAPAVAGARQSKRLRSKNETKDDPATDPRDSDTAQTTFKKDYEPIRHWALDATTEPISNPNIIWNASTMHQHLELSNSSRTVVTSGCAGYGGVMARPSGTPQTSQYAEITSRKKAFGKTWALKILCEGVGGFAFGVARTNASKPFKSLGNRADCWVLHSTGELLHNRHRTNLSLGYAAGDVVQVKVGDKGDLSFIVGDEEVKTSIILPQGKYVLCCQPYMGGAASIV
jgi:hypothetical protein